MLLAIDLFCTKKARRQAIYKEHSITHQGHCCFPLKLQACFWQDLFNEVSVLALLSTTLLFQHWWRAIVNHTVPFVAYQPTVAVC